MKIIVEAEISDTEVKKLEEMGYDVNYPFSTTVNLDDDGCKLFCFGDNDYKRFLKEK